MIRMAHRTRCHHRIPHVTSHQASPAPIGAPRAQVRGPAPTAAQPPWGPTRAAGAPRPIATLAPQDRAPLRLAIPADRVHIAGGQVAPA